MAWKSVAVCEPVSDNQKWRPGFQSVYKVTPSLYVLEVSFFRKNGTSITPEDYKKLQEENARLHTELKREKLRADFYEEMVAFGKEVYGIDLKKAGTK